jgi:hypothetical protein
MTISIEYLIISISLNVDYARAKNMFRFYRRRRAFVNSIANKFIPETRNSGSIKNLKKSMYKIYVSMKFMYEYRNAFKLNWNCLYFLFLHRKYNYTCHFNKHISGNSIYDVFLLYSYHFYQHLFWVQFYQLYPACSTILVKIY